MRTGGDCARTKPESSITPSDARQTKPFLKVIFVSRRAGPTDLRLGAPRQPSLEDRARLGSGDESVGILLKQEAFPHQLPRRLLHGLHEPVMILVALLE